MINKLSRITAAVSVLICIAVLFTSCGSISKKEYTAKSKTAVPAFNDVFVSFSELKNTSAELLNERPSEEWWIKFYSVYNDAGSILETNNKLLAGGSLGEVDKQLADVLSGVAKSYYDSFEIMNAAFGNEDIEIINYAYNEFSVKIANANAVWEEQLAAVTANSEISQNQ